jgi:putative heme-binding domain-containing protein
MLAGFRNAYDFDFNADGELFTFDSDMEWDWGLPWYRPTRINHCTLSSEHGWRSGSADWPEYYADSLPPVVNIGVGSPTGVRFGTNSKFPSKYKKAMFILDWSYGRIIAVHLTPQGASYAGEYETFLKGKPLNVADIDFGKDGAMYFVTGGRGTQSGLYRVSYVGGKGRAGSPLPAATTQNADGAHGVARPTTAISRQDERAAAQARALRRKLEAFHGKKDPSAVNFAWPHLRSDDPYIRFAARIAIEWQDISQWKDRAIAETNINGGLEGLLALARCGGKETQRDLLMALRKFPLDSLSLTQQLAKLRIVQLSFIRQGKPDADLAKLAMEKLDQHYPANNELLNRELSQLLIYLESPTVVAKTLALLDKAKTQEEQAHYIFYLRNLKTGWTVRQRRHYFEWFRFAQEATKGQVTYPQGSPYFVWANQKKAAERHSADLLRWFKEAGREYGDGASYPKFLVNFRKDAVASLNETERIALGGLLDDPNLIASYKQTKERKFVKEWKLADLEPALERVASGRNFQNAKAAFNDSQCILCHRLGNEGGSVGPELTGASSKYSRRDILESILEPSKVLSDQYQNYIVVKKDGEDVTGKIVDETDDKLGIEPNPLEVKRIDVKKSDITERRPSKVSPMPEGLVNQLTEEEILDLLAYIEAAGKDKAANFTPSRERQASKQ